MACRSWTLTRIDGGPVADFVGLAVADAALDARAGHPDQEAVRVVVAAVARPARRACGRTRRPRSPASSRSSPRCLRSVSRPSIGTSVAAQCPVWLLGQVAVGVPLAVAVDLHEPHAALDQPAGHQALGAERARRVAGRGRTVPASRPISCESRPGRRPRSACGRPARRTRSGPSGRPRPACCAQVLVVQLRQQVELRPLVVVGVTSFGPLRG